MPLRIVLTLLLFALCGSPSVFAEAPTPERVIGRFYELLFQEASPSAEDERLFFGESEAKTVLNVLPPGSRKSSSGTPIWTFLREHRHWFITEGHDHVDEIVLTFSLIAPDVFLKPKSSYHFAASPIYQKSAPRVFVTLLRKRVTKSGYDGTKHIIFTLGEESWLQVSKTQFLNSNEMLFEKIFELRKSERQ